MQEFTAREYIKIDIANSYGHDKLDWQDRINWFDLNQNRLESLISSADKPAKFYAGLMAWKDVNQNKPIGYPVSLDSTASGMQLLACLTGDRKAAELCNVVNVGGRQDSYTILYQRMCSLAGSTERIQREDIKKSIMTSLYGSEREPENIFGTGELLDIFYDVMEEFTPGCWELNRACLDMWDPTEDTHSWIMPDNFHVNIFIKNQRKEIAHVFDTPYEVITSMHAPKRKGRSISANITHSVDGFIVREMVRRCSYDYRQVNTIGEYLVQRGNDEGDAEVTIKNDNDLMVFNLWNRYLESGFLSARILQHLNQENIHFVDRDVVISLVLSLPNKPFKILTVHDCFSAHPLYINDMRKQYRQQLVELSKSEMATYLFSQLLRKPINVGKLDPELWRDVEHTEYALS